jgi:chromosome segregation ATPase
MKLILDGVLKKNPLRKRIAVLRRKVQDQRNKYKEKALKKVFHINVSREEFQADPDTIVFDEVEVDPKVRMLKTQVTDLEAEITRMQQKLEESEDTQEKNKQLENKLDSLLSQFQEQEEKNRFLSNHYQALATETEENQEEIASLKSTIKGQQKIINENVKQKTKSLGRKNIQDLGPDAINKTKAAYKKKFVDDVNKFGATRGLGEFHDQGDNVNKYYY